MMFRVLGAAALFLGALFGVVTLLVLLPFFSNYSTSLLILAAVFGVFTYVFLAIGWQLFHPPARRRGSLEEAMDEDRWASVSAKADEHAVVLESPDISEAVVEEHTEVAVEEPSSGSTGVLAADSEPIVDAPDSTFSGFAPVPRGGEPRMGEADAPDSRKAARSGNGHASERAPFKKPGRPVPERSEYRR